ncbi:MAG: T9SS type A sorting domain-containing protein [Ignavibacteriales bacterium]|nr:T9SS type A sorting domain-containing protein [Ignavibacteriales bacterium]
MKWFLLFLLSIQSFSFGQQWKVTALDYKNVNDVASRKGSLFAATSTGLFVSYNGGAAFYQVSLPAATPQYTYSFAAIGDSLFVSTGQGVLVSTTNDTVWTKVNTSPTSGYFYSYKGILFVDNSGVNRSTNRGQTWQPVPSIPSSFSGGEFAVSGSKIVYGMGYGNGIYLSTDAGVNWTQSNSGLGKDTNIFSLCAANGVLVASTTTSPTDSNIIYQSTDEGSTWQRIAKQPVSGILRSFYVAGTSIFGEAYGKLYRSTNGGLTWVNVNSGLSTSISAINAFTIVGDTLYAGTTVGVWKRPLSDFGITDVHTADDKLPVQYSLSQNYPNPFNPTTNIEYRLSNTEFVSLKVFDLLGREVATLVNEAKSSGTHEVNFNAKNLSSGIYLYQLSVGAHVETRRMVLLK